MLCVLFLFLDMIYFVCLLIFNRLYHVSYYVFFTICLIYYFFGEKKSYLPPQNKLRKKFLSIFGF
jgi:hypothetical protein